MVSVVIVAYNSKKHLESCLASLDGLHGLEVILFDNASCDGTVSYVTEHFPSVRVIASDKNLGFAAGNNAAIKTSSGRYVLLLNPDTVAHPGALQRLVAYLDEDPTVGIVAPRLLNPDGSLQPSCRMFPTPRAVTMRLTAVGLLFHDASVNEYLRTDWRHDTEQDVDQPMGACLLVRREVIDSVGLLDDRFFMYFEEVDFCYRVKRAGWRVCFLPDAQVVHFGQGSVVHALDQMNFEYHRSMIMFFEKHRSDFSERSLAVMRWAFMANAALMAVCFFVLSLVKRGYRTKARRAAKTFREFALWA